MAQLKNEFSWSFSRNKMFRECRRAYYYYYYASWGGWRKDSDELAQKTYVLKKMQNLDMWAGSTVHDILLWILQNRKGKKVISYEEAIEKTHDRLDHQWQQSKNRTWLANPKANLNLFEHYYNRPITQELIDRKVKRKVYLSLKHFYDSNFLEYIDSLSPEQFLRIEEMDSFIFEETKMYVIPDFAVSDGYVKLYDWKTGNPNPDDALQLTCYALYAHTKWDVPFDEIQIFPVYLARGIPEFAPWQEGIDKDAILAFLHTSVQQMHEVLSRGPQTNEIIYERCPQTENKRKCETCVFQEVCL